MSIIPLEDNRSSHFPGKKPLLRENFSRTTGTADCLWRILLVRQRNLCRLNALCPPAPVLGSRAAHHRGRKGFDRVGRRSDCVSWLVGWPRKKPIKASIAEAQFSLAA